MGHKVHPTSFRIGAIYTWRSQWYADQDYAKLLREDREIRDFLNRTLGEAGISRVEIERNISQLTVSIHTAKPGIVIGRGGQKVDELRTDLEKLTGRRVRVNIQEIRTPELDAYLVARNVADQLERRVAFRRAIKQAVLRTRQRGAEGVRIRISGRLGGAEMSRSAAEMDGRVPLHTIRADIDYGFAEAHTVFGQIGVKCWIYKGEILPAAAEGRGDEREATGPAHAVPPPPSSPLAQTGAATGGSA
ncbi:MAG: 30S ribosomal protein S3 [Chloroflexi bacterium]|nr:30S ribosomal protein S3 [Chloroflexota bacterium]